jgi:plasmid stabilization system protein ParE
VNIARRPRFLLDLAEELYWLKDKAGAEVAERWYDALLATIQFIGNNPFAGRERKDLHPAGIRSWRVRGFPRWLIFYAVTSQKKVVFYSSSTFVMGMAVSINIGTV